MFGLAISPLTYNIYSYFAPTPGNVVALNSDTINKMAIVCDLLHGNSDIMARYSHYLAPHTKLELFCMECTGNPGERDEMLLEEPIDDGKTKVAQVHDDYKEINKSMTGLIQALNVQRETLSIALQRMKDQSYPK